MAYFSVFSSVRFLPRVLGIFSLLVILLCLPASKAIGQASSQTTPIDKFASEILLPLAEQALSSSETSDAELQALKKQKIADDAQRKIEQENSATLLKAQSDRALTLQTYSDNLLAQLGDLSGSEEEKQAAALKAIKDMQKQAIALEREKNLWRIAGIGGGAVAVIAIIVAIVK